MAEAEIITIPTASGTPSSPEVQAVLGAALMELVTYLQQFPHLMQAAILDSLCISWCMNAANPDEAWGALREAIERDIAAAQRMTGAGGSA